MPPSLDRFAEIPDPQSGREAEAHVEVAAPTEPSLTRTERTRRTRLAAGFGVLWIASLAVGLGLRDDSASAAIAVPFALMVAIAAITLVVTMRPGERGLPRGAHVVQALIGALLGLFIVITIWITIPELDVSASADGGCFGVTALMAVGPLAVAALALQSSFLSAPALRGAAIGAVCGLGAAAGITLHCGMVTRGHVLLAHGTPLLLATAAGAILGALRGRA